MRTLEWELRAAICVLTRIRPEVVSSALAILSGQGAAGYAMSGAVIEKLALCGIAVSDGRAVTVNGNEAKANEPSNCNVDQPREAGLF